MGNYKKHISFSCFLISLMALLAFKPVKAQKAFISIDTSRIRIGEQVDIRLHATVPKNARVYWPPLHDTLTQKIEIIGFSTIDSATANRTEYKNYIQRIRITSFDTGNLVIPPIPVMYSFPGDTTLHRLLTESSQLQVTTVAVDTTQAIRDIKPNMQAPITVKEVIPYVIYIAIALALMAIIWYYVWRRKANKPFIPIIIRTPGPPWQTALQELDDLEVKNMWQSGKVKEYYTGLTDILRNYLNGQHGIDAMEMTSSEILTAYKNTTLPEEPRKWLENILINADFVKFAKAVPLAEQNKQNLKYAREFVLATKPATPEKIEDENKTDDTLSTAEPLCKP